MAGFAPAIPPKVAETVRHLPPDVKRAVKAAIRALSVNPAEGEPLQGELEGWWKYRVRRYRIVYQVNRTQKTLQIIAVGHRRTIYEELAERRK